MVWTLYCGIDILVQEYFTKTTWTYDYELRNFYMGIWESIFAGSIVSLATSYIAYGRAKHQVEFSLRMSEQGMCRYLNSIVCGVYTADTMNTHKNICRFKNDYAKLQGYYAEMISAHNDYSPFIKSRKVTTLLSGKRKLENIWIELAGFEDDLLCSADENSTQKIISQYQAELLKSKETIKDMTTKLK